MTSETAPPGRPTRLSRVFLLLLYGLLFLSFLSGTFLWWGGRHWNPLETPELFSQLKWWRLLHGAANPVVCVLVGMLLQKHIPGGWKMRANRVSGGLLLGVLTSLIVTGVTLYYAGGEGSRWLARTIHWWGGLLLPLLLAGHLIRAWRWIRGRNGREG